MEVIRRLLGQRDEGCQVGRLVGKTQDGKWLVRLSGTTRLIEPVTDEPVTNGAQVIIRGQVGLGARK